MEQKQYNITLTGLTPLLMHNDNLAFAEKLTAWRKDPANKEHGVSGDDRSPPWTWVGYCYHDGRNLGVSSDNLMTMLREGGAKIINKGKETYKKQTQSGIMIDAQQFDLWVNGETVPKDPIAALVGEMDFSKHIELAESMGFELLVKRAKINKAKHIRVRPLFRDWILTGSITVLDEELTGLTMETIKRILNQAGALCGLCDWRPSSPSSGTFGKFSPEIEEI